MTPLQKEDFDKEMDYESRDYDEWKPLNRRDVNAVWQRRTDMTICVATWIVGILFGAVVFIIAGRLIWVWFK